MNIENLKNDILRNYNDVLQSLNNGTEQSFLDSLTALEASFANYILQALNIDKYTQHIKGGENSEYIDNKGLELTISKRILGTKVTIMNLLNQGIKKFTQNKQNPDTSTDYEKTKKTEKNSLETPLININEDSPNINYEIINKPEIQKIINTVQSHRNRNTDYAIRYVVVMISRLVKRDINFFFSPEQEKLKQLPVKTYNDYPNVICKTLSELIRDILYLLGINSKVIIATNSKVPLYALIVEGEKCRYFIDSLNDLTRVQYHIQPRHYGIFNISESNILDYNNLGLSKLGLDDIKEMDIEMKLIKGQYFSDFINSQYQRFNKSKNVLFPNANNKLDLIIEKIQYISDNYLNEHQVNGPIERAGLLIYFRNSLFNPEEKELIRIENRHEPDYPAYITIEYFDKILVFEEVNQNSRYSLKQI